MKDLETQKEMKNELYKVEEELKRYNTQQSAENNRLLQKIKTLKVEKSNIQLNVQNLHKQLSELEMTVGHKNQ